MAGNVKPIGFDRVRYPGETHICSVYIYPTEDNKEYKKELVIERNMGKDNAKELIVSIPFSKIISFDFHKPFLFGDVGFDIVNRIGNVDTESMVIPRSYFNWEIFTKMKAIIVFEK